MSDRKSKQDEILEAILTQLEECVNKGYTLPWYNADFAAAPMNVATRKFYNGGNAALLWLVAYNRNWRSNLWGTFNQWKALGASVKKGSKGLPIVFFKRLEDDEATEDDQPHKFICQHSHVFNVEQVEGYSPDPIEKVEKINPNARVDELCSKAGIVIVEGGARACYVPQTDQIMMPDRWRFSSNSDSTAAWYATLLHEAVHWTAHEKRLNRDTKNYHVDKVARLHEELVAELGSALLCGQLGVTNKPRDDHANYINAWLQIAKQDKSFLKGSIRDATKAASYLMGFAP